MKCSRCGYEWKSRVERPKACPDCKRRDWDKVSSPKPASEVFDLTKNTLPNGSFEEGSFGIWSVEVAPGGHIPTPYIEMPDKSLPTVIEFTFDSRVDNSVGCAALQEAGYHEPLIDGARYRVTFDRRQPASVRVEHP